MIQKKQANKYLDYDQVPIYQQFNFQNQGNTIYKFVSENIFIVMAIQNKGTVLKCVNRQGKVLSRLQYHIPSLKQSIIVSERQIVILEKDQKNIFLILWNFAKNTFHRIPIKILIQTQFNHGILFFKQTQLICYWDRSKQEKVQLTYFKLSEIKLGIPVHEYVCEDLVTKEANRHRILKLNQKSMVGFFFYFVEIQHNFCVKFYDLDLNLQKEKEKGCLKKFQISITSILQIQKFSFLSCCIIDIWQASPHLFYIQTQPFINNIHLYNSQRTKQFNPQKCQRYHTFYHNFQENTTKIAQLNIPSPHRVQFIGSIKQLQYIEKQKESLQKRIFQSTQKRMMERSKLICLPIYYMEPDGEKILMMNQPLRKVFEERFVWGTHKTDKMFKIWEKKQRQEVTVYQFASSWLALSYGLKNLSVDWIIQYLDGYCDDDLLEKIYTLL